MTKKLYQCFFDAAINRIGEQLNIVPTPWRDNTVSKHSKTFAMGRAVPSTMEEAADVLIRTFGITDTAQYREKLKEACSGSGREYRRICTAHSSALMTLNYFYRVSLEHPLYIEGETYTQALFEVKNRVFANPSNIDVLLVSSADGSSADVKNLLYLESKLTEYIATAGKCAGISSDYMPFYKELGLYTEGKEIIDISTNNFALRLCKDGKAQYSEGMKQMVSHFIGLTNGPATDASEKYKQLFENAETLTLGEIVFKFDDFENKFTSYAELYAELSSALRSHTWKKEHKCQIKVLPHLLTYQDIANKPENDCYMKTMPQSIRNFYNL